MDEVGVFADKQGCLTILRKFELALWEGGSCKFQKLNVLKDYLERISSLGVEGMKPEIRATGLSAAILIEGRS